MKFLTARESAATKRMAVLLLIILTFCGSAGASEKLFELRLGNYGANGIMLFPDHETKGFNVVKESPAIIRIDFYDWQYSGASTIIPAPHSLVKFMRVSQANSRPDVVRVFVVFNEPFEVKAQKVGKSLVLEAVGASPTAHSSVVEPSAGATYAASPAASAMASPREPGTALDARISLKFDQEDLMTILNALAVKFNLRIFADSGVKGKFSVHAQDVTLREILKNLLLQRNFQYTLKGRDLTVISLNTESGRMARELLFRDLSLKDALQTLSKMMNINLIIHESVEDKKVNFYVENLNLDELLDLLIDTNGLVKKPHNDNTYVILSRENAGDFGKKKFRTFKLVNAKPEEVVNMISSNKSLSDKINTENFSLNERINTLSVYDTAENVALIEKVINSVDEKVKQAVIEVKLVEINRTSLRQMGIKLDSYNVNVADIGRLPSNYALPATLDFLEQDDKARVLASPKIRAVHGRKASINIGEVIPVPYFRYENASNSYLGSVPQVFKEYRDVQVGIRLEVTPEITRDNEISLELKTTVDSVLSINEDGQIHRSERNTDTFVRIKNGETVVLGGLINQQGSEVKKAPSLLSRVPFLSSLVTNTNAQTRNTEMIMLVTPRLVNMDEEYDARPMGNVQVTPERLPTW